MKRRHVLATAATLLAAPRLGRAASDAVLRFVPSSDLAILDPGISAAYVTRNHALLVFDTLYGQDNAYRPSPQMLAGHVVEDDGRRWTLTLRDGLRFHDGEPVRGTDVVASLRRWGRVDAFGQALLAATDELSAPTDATVVFRMKRPFPLLPTALAKVSTYCPVVMPARLAGAEPGKPISEMTGSGPFRFLAGEYVPGSRAVYERFPGYVPRADGITEFTAGPKVAHLDRVEWITMPDAATAAAALRTGEVDWVDTPAPDLVPSLQRSRNVTVRVLDPMGTVGTFRFNLSQKPFDDVRLRRALLGAFDQRAFMNAIVGDDPANYDDHVGVFSPGSPMATDVGLDALTGPRNLDAARAAVKASSYAGEKVVLLGASDIPAINALAEVAADTIQKCGLQVDFVASDWGSTIKRRTNRGPLEQGGWSGFCGTWSGLDFQTPAGHLPIRGNGQNAWSGWPVNPRLEELRDAWFAAPDLAAQQAICRDIQREVWSFVPYIPLGKFTGRTAYRSNITGMLSGVPLFWNVRKNS